MSDVIHMAKGQCKAKCDRKKRAQRTAAPVRDSVRSQTIGGDSALKSSVACGVPNARMGEREAGFSGGRDAAEAG